MTFTQSHLFNNSIIELRPSSSPTSKHSGDVAILSIGNYARKLTNVLLVPQRSRRYRSTIFAYTKGPSPNHRSIGNPTEKIEIQRLYRYSKAQFQF